MARAEAKQRKDRPYVFAIVTLILAGIVTAGMVAWASESPESVLIGLHGRHDARGDGVRLAACLDCHVPFVGSPGSRCLSPGCHGALATGTPPRDGKAMPIRFHAALRDQPCSICHTEHTEKPVAELPKREFTHDLIPEAPREACQRCHSGAREKDHTRTDAVACKLCHETSTWRGVKMDHQKVWQHACDVCHRAPTDATHASVAGTCSACHSIDGWKAKPVTPPPAPQ